MPANPASNAASTIYYMDSSGVQRFASNAYVGTWSNRNDQFATGIGYSSSREIYRLSLNSIDVLGFSGQITRTISDTRFQALAAIAIDSTQRKYVVDIGLPGNLTPTIHVLDASDQYVTGFALHYSTQQTRDARLVIAPDGNLILSIYFGSIANEAYVKKLRPADASEIWSKSYSGSQADPVSEIGVDSAGRIYALRSQMDVLDASGNVISSFPFPSDGTRPRSNAPMVGVGSILYAYFRGTVYGFTMEP